MFLYLNDKTDEHIFSPKVCKNKIFYNLGTFTGAKHIKSGWETSDETNGNIMHSGPWFKLTQII